MRYSIEPRERIHVKGYGFLSFARNIGTHATKTAKNISNKYGQKTAEATGDLVGKKIADKITSASKKYFKKLRDEESSSTEVNNEIPKERCISPKERQHITDELKLM